MPDFVIYGWQGVLAPTGTPPAVIERAECRDRQGARDPDLKARLSGQGTEPAFTSADEFRDYIAAEHKRWSEVMRSANITVD